MVKKILIFIIVISLFFLFILPLTNPSIQNQLNDTSTSKNYSGSGAWSNLTYISLPKYATITSATLNLTGFQFGDSNTGALSVGRANYSMCYQESVNISNQTGVDGNCELSYDGNYNTLNGQYSNSIDGSFTTYDEIAGDTLYINYTKPVNSTISSLWRIKDGGGEFNLSILQSCWDYNSTTLLLQVISNGGNAKAYWNCYNGSWINLKTNSWNTIYEESMWWGIDTGRASIVDDATVGTVAWSNPTYANSSDNVYARFTDDSGGPKYSHYLKLTNFSFSIPTRATIKGVLVEIERYRQSGSSYAVITDKVIKLIKADGSLGTNNNSVNANWSTVKSYISFGSSSDLWGDVWTAENINDVDFGVVLQAYGGGNMDGIRAYVDHIRITVYYNFYPSNVSLQVNNSIIFNQTLDLTTENQTVDFKNNVTDFLATCTADINNYCNLPLNISGTNGTIQISAINITYMVNPPNITSPANSTITYPEGLFVDFDGTGMPLDTWSVNDTTRFQINSTGGLTNKTILPAGTWLVNVSVNDTLGNMNSSMWQVTVNKNTLGFFIFSNETSPINYPNAFTVYSNSTTPFTLYRNGTPITNASTQGLASGTYNFTIIRTDQVNYSNVINTTIFQVNQNTETVYTLFNTSNSITYPTVFKVSSNATSPFKIYRNGTEVSNASTQSLSAGTYNFTTIRTDGSNYSDVYDEQTIQVNKVTTALDLIVTTPIIYGATSDFTGVSCPGSLVCTLNDTNKVFGVGTVTFNYSTPGNENFTSDWVIKNLVINQNTTSFNILVNETSPISYPNAFKVYSNTTTAFTLYRNGTPITNASTQGLASGTYNFTIIRTDQVNYSNIYNETTFRVDKSASACNVVLNETSPVIYPITPLVYSNCDSTFVLYRNATIITNNTQTNLGSKTYNFTVIRTDKDNYTNIYDEETFQINKATLSGSLNNTFEVWAYEVGNATNISHMESNAGDGDVNYTIYNQSIYTLNNTKFNESIGIYTLVLNSTGGENYSSNNNITTKLLNFSDTIAPNLYLEKPQNIQYAYLLNLPLNFTVLDYYLDKCWVKLTNSTGDIILNNQSVTNCLNTTFNVPRDDIYNLTLWTNDTTNNLNYSSVQFQTITTAPAIDLIYPSNNEFFNTTQNIYFNFSANSSGIIDYGLFYTNFDGTWKVNQTFTGIISNVQNYTIKNITDGTYKWTMWYNDTSSNSQFALSNRTVTIDTIKPFVDINTITTTAGSPTFTFTSTETDTNLQNCKYSIYNSTGGIDNLRNNISFTCNIQTSSSVSDWGTYNLTIYITDHAGNLNSSTKSFTTSALVVSTPGGGGGGTTEQRFPVIGISSINSSKVYSELDRAIVYSQINSYCSNKVRNEPLAIADYSKSCSLVQSDLNILLPTLDINTNMNDLTLFYKGYKESRFFQFYATQSQINSYDLFTSVLGLTTLLQLNPSSLDQPVFINIDGRNYTLVSTFASNKPLKGCDIIEGDKNIVSCIVQNSSVTVRYLLNNTKFFNDIFKTVVSVQTDAPQNQLESKKLPVVFRVYNVGWNVLGIPLLLFIPFGLLFIITLFIIGYKIIPKTKRLNIQKSLELAG